MKSVSRILAIFLLIPITACDHRSSVRGSGVVADMVVSAEAQQPSREDPEARRASDLIIILDELAADTVPDWYEKTASSPGVCEYYTRYIRLWSYRDVLMEYLGDIRFFEFLSHLQSEASNFAKAAFTEGPIFASCTEMWAPGLFYALDEARDAMRNNGISPEDIGLTPEKMSQALLKAARQAVKDEKIAEHIKGEPDESYAAVFADMFYRKYRYTAEQLGLNPADWLKYNRSTTPDPEARGSS